MAAAAAEENSPLLTRERSKSSGFFLAAAFSFSLFFPAGDSARIPSGRNGESAGDGNTQPSLAPQTKSVFDCSDPFLPRTSRRRSSQTQPPRVGRPIHFFSEPISSPRDVGSGSKIWPPFSVTDPSAPAPSSRSPLMLFWNFDIRHFNVRKPQSPAPAVAALLFCLMERGVCVVERPSPLRAPGGDSTRLALLSSFPNYRNTLR